MDVESGADKAGGLDALSDLELVSRVNAGDEAAFEVLYHRHKGWVVNLAYRWTNDRDAALDILQETFFYFAKKFPGFRLTAKLQTFFYPVVRNLSIAARHKAERFRPEDQASDAQAELAADAAPVAAAAVRRRTESGGNCASNGNPAGNSEIAPP